MDQSQLKEIGFVAACKAFFGFAPDQTLAQFRDEVAQLTPKDRKEMTPMLEKELGVPIKRAIGA